jgi:hypothetical protein
LAGRKEIRRADLAVRRGFNGVDPDAIDEEIAAIAPGYPVYVVETVEAA